MMTRTYRLDTANPFKQGSAEWCRREQKLREQVHNLLIYLLNKSHRVVLKYWPSDFQLPHDLEGSTFGVKKLLPLALKVTPITPYGMEELICAVNAQTINNLLPDLDKGGEKMVPWFHLELWDEKGMILLLIADFGEDVLMNLTDDDLKVIKEMVDMDLLLAIQEETKQV